MLIGIGSSPARADGFATGTQWSGWFSIGNETPEVGDFNGDGLDDVLTFLKSTVTDGTEGDVYVATSNGNDFVNSTLWKGWFSPGAEIPRVGDFNGDRRDDVVTFVQSTQTDGGAGDVWVALSDGSSFGANTRWHTYFSIAGEIPLTGDFNGDNRDDIITFLRNTATDSRQGDVYVSLSNGSGFGASATWHTWFCVGSEVPLVGDFNGDGRDDIVSFLKSTQTGSGEGDVYVALSSGSAFGASSLWDTWFSPGSEVPRVGDINGDGRDDIITFVKSTATGNDRSDVWVALSTGSSFGPLQQWHESFGVGAEVVMTGKFNRDSKSDVVDFYRSAYTDSRRGDVYVGLAEAASEAGPATLDDFGYLDMVDSHGYHAVGERPLLVVLMDDPNEPAWTNCTSTNAACRSFYDDLIFGPGFPNVTDYYSEVSYLAFTFTRAAVLGPYNYPAGSATDPRGETFRHAIRAAAADIDYDQFDVNNDGEVDNSELTVLIIDNRTVDNGMTALSSSITPPGSSVSVQVEGAAAGEDSAFLTIVHELGHTLGAHDLYGSSNLSRGLTLMSDMECAVNCFPEVVVTVNRSKDRTGGDARKLEPIFECPDGTRQHVLAVRDHFGLATTRLVGLALAQEQLDALRMKLHVVDFERSELRTAEAAGEPDHKQRSVARASEAVRKHV